MRRRRLCFAALNFPLHLLQQCFDAHALKCGENAKMIAERSLCVGMIPAEACRADLNGATSARLGLGEPVRGLEELRQIAEGAGHIWVPFT